MSFQIVNKDITSLKVDALVNSTNDAMIGTSGVDGLIHKLGGPEFEQACAQHKNQLRLGEALYTKAYGKLNCKYVIHTACCFYINGLEGEPVILKSCYRESLRIADNLGCKSVAFPLINAGNMEYPIEEALGIAISSITEYLNYTKSKLKVILTIYGEAAEAVARTVLKDLDTYIDIHMYESPDRKQSSANYTSIEPTPNEATFTLGESFSNMLIRLMNERELTDPEVYGPLYMPRQTFNNLVNEKVKNPKRETIIGIALIMKLSIEETEDLLGAAGLKLSNNNMFDLIIKYCIEHQQYNINVVNTQLVKYGVAPIFV